MREVKGSLTRDFRLQVFVMNQCPPGPQVFHWGRFEFFQKFAEIFAGVNDTAEKLLAGVNDTADKLFDCINDTGDERVLPILACKHLKIKNKQKFTL
jgi:hypothetical protein